MTGRALTAYSLSLLLAELAALDQAAHRLDADQADATPTELVLAASSIADQAEKLVQRANQLLRHACRAEER